MLTKEQIEQWREWYAKFFRGESAVAIGGSIGFYALCDMALAHLEACEQEHAATVADVYQSRYTLEWNGRNYPEGTKLYARPVPVQSPWVECSERLPTEKDAAPYMYVHAWCGNYQLPNKPQYFTVVEIAIMAKYPHTYPNLHWSSTPKPPEAK